MIVAERLFRFNVIARAFALLSAAITSYLGWLSPSSLTGRILSMGGEIGVLALVLLSLAAAVGLLDILINDMMPPRFTLRIVAQHRHSGYNLIGLLYLVQAVPGMSLDAAGSAGLVAYYCGVGMLCGWLAWALVIRGRDEVGLLDAA